MKITKIGHCCLQIDVGDVRIVTDPGAFSDGQNDIEDIDAVILTHEHADHCHVESLIAIKDRNAAVKIYANQETGKLLTSKSVAFELITDGDVLNISGVEVKTWNCEHEEIYGDIAPVLNTALLIHGKILYPGDAFFIPEDTPVDVLALPAEGPWMRTSEAIDYALTIGPKEAFPVHDARLDPALGNARYAHYDRVLSAHGIAWHNLTGGSELQI